MIDDAEELDEFSGKPIDYGTNKQTRINGRLVGYTIKGEHGPIFMMPKRKRHKFRMYNSWGIPQLLLDELIQKNYWLIKIIVQDADKILSVRPENWKRKGFEHRSKGFEPQMQLREKDFDKVVG